MKLGNVLSDMLEIKNISYFYPLLSIPKLGRWGVSLHSLMKNYMLKKQNSSSFGEGGENVWHL